MRPAGIFPILELLKTRQYIELWALTDRLKNGETQEINISCMSVQNILQCLIGLYGKSTLEFCRKNIR